MKRLAVASFFLFLASNAHAGERSALSSLPTMPASKQATEAPKGPIGKMGVRGLSFTEVKTWRPPNLEMNTENGYCLVSRDNNFVLTGSAGGSGMPDELWRFTETEGAASATLERTFFEVVESEKTAWVKSRDSVELQLVAKPTGIVPAIWAFRETDGNVVLMSRGARSGHQTQGLNKDSPINFVSSGCSYGATRMASSLLAKGAIVNLTGVIEIGEGKEKKSVRYGMDASAFKGSRDTEPFLSVRTRTFE